MNFDILDALKALPAAILGFTVHEWAHAYMAYSLGDTTAQREGRLTLNPVKHIDILGLIVLVVAGFGWAKPVRFDPAQLKNPHADEIKISLAGPASNLILGVLFFLMAKGLYSLELINTADPGIAVVNLLILWGTVNFGLFVFNLIPIPPLDGSHLYTTFLAKRNPALTQTLYQFGSWILLGLVVLQNQSGITLLPFGWMVDLLRNGCMNLLHFR